MLVALLFNETFKIFPQKSFPEKYRTEEINYNFSNHDYGFLYSSHEIPDEGMYFIWGRKAKYGRRKLLENFHLRALKPSMTLFLINLAKDFHSSPNQKHC